MTCPISLPQEPGHCHWCGKELRGRQRRWCSDLCGWMARVNHDWTTAKAIAKGKSLAYARGAGQGDCFVCAACREFFDYVEVDHIVPCRGKHGVWGCWHHSTNLRTLCRGCHRQKTADDRANGWSGPVER